MILRAFLLFKCMQKINLQVPDSGTQTKGNPGHRGFLICHL